MRRNSINLVARGVALACLALSINSAQAEEASISTAQSETTEQTARHVEQLGSDIFEERETAERALRKIGLPALTLLRTARRATTDVEVRRRLDRITPEIEAADQALRLAAFMQDTNAEDDHGLAGWQRFRKIVGVSVEARKLFADMYEFEPALMRLNEADPSETLAVWEERCVAISRPRHVRGGSQPMQQPYQSTLALMFVGSRAEMTISDPLTNQIASLAHSPLLVTHAVPTNSGANATATKRDPRSQAIKQIVSEWIEHRSGTLSSFMHLHLADRYQLDSVALKLSRDMLDRPGLQAGYRAQALSVLERYGTKDDVPRVEKLFDDRGICVNMGQPDKRSTIEVREVALTVAILLTGQSPNEFGLSKFSRVAGQPIAITLMDYGDDKGIEKALALWKERTRSNQKR